MERELKTPRCNCATCKHMMPDAEYKDYYQCSNPKFSELCWQMGYAEGPICIEPKFGCLLHEPNDKTSETTLLI